MNVALAAPLGLALLATVPVILWLHLRHRRARRVVVPALAPWLLLRAARPPTRRQVPRSLLLWLRVAAAVCLALAAAQPTAPRGVTGAVSRVVILDSSASMGASGIWPVAVAHAADLLAAAEQNAVLVAMGPRPQVVGSGSATAARAALATLQPGGTGADVGAALALARAVAPSGAELVVVTDGRLAQLPPDAPAARWDIVGEGADNVAIVAAQPRVVGRDVRLFARIANFGHAAVNADLVLTVDGRPQDRRALRLAAGASEELLWTLPAGAGLAELQLEHADALTADNVATIPLATSPRQLQVAGASPSGAVERALDALPDTVVQRVGAATYRTDGAADGSVFVGLAPDTLPPGGVVLVNPPADPRLGIGTARRDVTLAGVGDDPLLVDLDLDGVRLSGVADVTLPNWARPVLRAGNQTLAYVGRLGDTRVLVLAFDPEQGGLSRRLAFPLLMARAVAAVAGARPAAVVSAGERVDGPPGTGWAVIDPAGRRRSTNATLVDTELAGAYRFESNRPGTTVRLVSALAGDAAESNLWSDVIRPSASAPSEGAAARRAWWPWLAALALALVVAELLLRVAAAQAPAKVPVARSAAP